MNTQNAYLETERNKMRETGYITVSEAAIMAGVHVSQVYRKLSAKGSKLRYKIGDNARSKYVHLKDWERFVAERKERLKAALAAAAS
jgi:hypothetical protein